MEKYITYYRVSTKKQGKSDNGINAQRTAVINFLEYESGRKTDRPVLKTAVERCKDSGANLLIAKLDRLTRNVAFLSEKGVGGCRD